MIYMYTTERNLKSDMEHRLVRPVGVELGTQLAQRIIPELKSKERLFFPMIAQPIT